MFIWAQNICHLLLKSRREHWSLTQSSLDSDLHAENAAPPCQTYPHFSFVHPQKQLSVDAESQGDVWGSQQTQLVAELLGRDILLAVTSVKWTRGVGYS